MVRLCGAFLGLLAFGATLVIGLLGGLPAEIIMLRAVTAMFVFCAIGLITGWAAYRIMDEHAVNKHRELFPEETEEGAQDQAKEQPDEQQQTAEAATG
jgi:hypothetical protein